MSRGPATLKKYVFFINVQMILLPFFDIPKPKFINLEKPILSVSSRPQPGKNCLKLPSCGLELTYKIGFSKITDFWSGISKNGSNII